jgi:hypothetical protein
MEQYEHLSDEIAGDVVQSEIEGGVFLSDLQLGTLLELETHHHRYCLRNLGQGKMEISGHPEYCPEPTEVDVLGSSWGGTLLKSRYVGRGMRLEFWHPSHDLVVTSPILEMRQVV